MHTCITTLQARAWKRSQGRHWVDHQLPWEAIEPHDRVLDVGTGNGQTSHRAARQAPHDRVLGLGHGLARASQQGAIQQEGA